jgi:hypothetical protein
MKTTEFYLRATLFVVLYQLALHCVKWEPLESFTAYMFAFTGAGMGWEATNGGYGPEVYVPALNCHFVVVPACTYQALFAGLLAWVVSRRVSTTCWGILLAVLVTLVANLTRFHVWLQFKSHGLLSEGEWDKYFPAYTMITLGFFLGYWYWARFVVGHKPPVTIEQMPQALPLPA